MKTLTFTEASLAAAIDNVQCHSDLGAELIAESVFADHTAQDLNMVQQVEQKPVGHVYTMQPCFPGEPKRAHAQLHVALPEGTKLYTHPAPQQPGQDVEGLVEALKAIAEGRSNESAPHIARTALAAHDKQSGEVGP